MSMRKNTVIFWMPCSLFFLIVFSSIQNLTWADEHAPIKTVPLVDLNRYLGKWYEIARFPNFFQKNCDKAIAQYSLGDNGEVDIVNICRKISDGTLEEVHGIARVEDTKTYAKLSVTFLPPWLRWTGVGRGKYWVIDLEPEYQFAVVSEPNRKYLWILSRTAEMKKSVYDGILSRLVEQGYDTTRLISSRDGNLVH